MAANDNPIEKLSLRRRGEPALRGRPPFDVRDFRSVYDAWVTDVARWIRAMGGPPADQDDVLQEVFVIVHRRLSDFDGGNIAGWLYQITARQVRDLRRRLWFKHIFKLSRPLTEEMPAPGPTPVTTLEVREKRETLDRLLSRLSEAQRAAFVLFEIEGYTAEEIAQMQGVSINTVRARILRARKKLTTLLRASAAAERGK
jgi:RNA polymerase sigma-70 factor (ECF subfamily)